MVTLQNVKDTLGISDTSQDTRITNILAGVNETLVNYIGDYSLGEKTIKVKNTALKDKIGLMHINMDIESEFSIDGNVITDFMLLDNGEVEVINLCSYVKSDFSYSTVKYTAGYSATPSDIILAVSNKVGFELSKELGQVVVTEKMGPRMVEFLSSDKTMQDVYNDFLKQVRRYIPLHLRIW